jgi:Spy/CpxP family protein refolding chaperone
MIKGDSMKRLIPTLAALTLVASTAVLAQPPAGGPPPGGQAMERLAQDLNLTEAQKPKVKAIFDEERPKLEAARAELKDATPDARRAKMQQLQQDLEQKLSGVLTPDQMQKFKAMQQQRRQQMQPQGAPPSSH